MPIPAPNQNESRDDFMSRCISFVMNEGTEQEQAIAICNTQWEENKMIKCKALNKSFETKKEMLAEIVKNKDVLIAQKKAILKKADGVNFYYINDNHVDKSDISQIDISNTDALNVRAVINTTNIMDSHEDVHIPGIWNKTLQENKNIMHLQEHELSFDKIIASKNDLEVYTTFYNWRDLGVDVDGQTQALEFNSNVKKNRNKFMFEQYANNYVTNHSVGMRYVKIFLAVNDSDHKEEFEVWNRYIGQVINREVAEEKGYFYAVTEAKLIEGSAVPVGSNSITPTRSVTPKNDGVILLNDLLQSLNKPSIEPEKSTQEKDTIDFLKNLSINI